MAVVVVEFSVLLARSAFLPVLVSAWIALSTTNAATAAPAKPAEKDKGGSGDGYFLKQRLMYQGFIDVRANNSGAKVRTKDLIICMDPASKDALVFNESNKKYCQLNPKIWLNKVADRTQIPKVQKGEGVATWKGHKVQQYLAKVYKADDTPGPTVKPRWIIEFWTAKDFKLPQKILDDYCMLVGIPCGYGLPLRMVRWNTPTNRELFLETFNVQSGKIENDTLHMSTSGFKKVANEMDVMLSESDDELSNIISEDQKKPAAQSQRSKPKASK